MSVTSLNTRQGSVNLLSSDSSVIITQSGVNDINLIASKQGTQGGVTSLQALTGPLTFTSAGHSVVITTPTLYPNGHVINIEASSTGLVGINTINSVTSDPASHNFSIGGSGNISVAQSGYGIVLADTSAQAVETINNLQPIDNNIEIYAGSGLSVVNSGNTVTLAYTGSVADAVETINSLQPLNNDIEIKAGVGLSVVNSGHTITLAYTGSVANAVETINNLQPIANNIEIYAGNGLSVVNSQNTITLAYTGSVADAVETINSLQPLNNDIEIVAGVGLSVVNSGHTITLTNTNTSTGGFELTYQGLLLYTGVNCSNSTAPYSVYISGESPNQIATVQIGVSGYSTKGSTPASFTATPVLPVGFLPKYAQRGTAWGALQTGSVPFSFMYLIDVDGLLTLTFDNPVVNIPPLDVFSLYGISLTFPIAVPLDFAFSLGFSGYNLQESVLPTTEPDPSILLTLAYSATTIEVLNLATGAGASVSVISNTAFSQNYTVNFNDTNAIITRYLYGTATVYDTLNLAQAVSGPLVGFSILGIACPADSDDCFAFCFNSTTGLHNVYNVYNTPVVNFLQIAIPAQASAADLRAISCSTTQLVCCYAHGLFGGTHSTNGFDILVGGGIQIASSVVDPERTTAFLDPSNNYYVSHASDSFFTSRNFISNAVIATFISPQSGTLSHFMGLDPYGNLLASFSFGATPPYTYELYAFNKVNQIIEYNIPGAWDTFAVPVCLGAMIEG